MNKNQPGTVTRFQAKPGNGDELFELLTSFHERADEDPDYPTDWVLSRDDSNPDVLWAFDFYPDDEAFARHFASPVQGGERVWELLDGDAEVVRANVHIFSHGLSS